MQQNLIDAARAVIAADRAGELTDEHIQALEAAANAEVAPAGFAPAASEHIGEAVTLQHVAVCEEGDLRWITGIAPRDCELYAMPDGGIAPRALYAAPPTAPVVPDVWQLSGRSGWLALVKSPITEDMHRAAVKVLVRANGVDGLPQRMLEAMLATAPAESKGGE
ncbi:hypothetical protein [Chromobacterium haemolyticum]|uniref:hypothetical protein n=1 Tax=Chromobacterium haemolyticum TaxID=394935 RepID=UPI00307F8083